MAIRFVVQIYKLLWNFGIRSKKEFFFEGLGLGV
jgi:hypothetical protein